MSEQSTPIRSIIVNSKDAEALRGAAEKIGWNFFLYPKDDDESTPQE